MTETIRRRKGRGDHVQARLLRFPRLHQAVRWVRLLGRFGARRPHSPYFAAFALFPERDGLFLDVGANVGTSAMSFRIYNKRSPILSIEANPDHAAALRLTGRLVSDFSYRILAAGAEAGTASLRIPYYGAIPLSGLASMDDVAMGDSLEWWATKVLGHPDTSAISYRTVEVAVAPLDGLDLQPDFVKIDVEGYELPVLEGLRATIDRCSPVILVEANDGIEAIARFLGERGYVPREYDLATGDFRPAGESTGSSNVFFIPGMIGEDLDRRSRRRPIVARG